ncbi:MAG: 3-keto-5-aminohexanoate cleavage protein [Actinobacteria bacterium]|nr:3-keto-5-aminohexanoate cleavage protein [Actinomycetota bacterium]
MPTREDRYRPSVLTAAITGGDVLPSQTPHLPCGVEEIVAAGIAAAEAGATVLHVHGREDDGRPSADPGLLAEIAAGIRAGTDAVLNMSTGGSPGMTEEERLAGLDAAEPDIGTFNLGTMNYELFPTAGRMPEVRHEWERAILETSGKGIFANPLGSLRRFAAAFRERGIAPELEAYDMGHITMARFLVEEGTLVPPLRLQLVLGVLGGATNTIETMLAMRDAAERELGGALASIGVAATGFPMEFRCAAVGLSLGMDIRVGLEDNIRIARGVAAESNADLVRAAITIADVVGRPIAAPGDLASYLEAWKS